MLLLKRAVLNLLRKPFRTCLVVLFVSITLGLFSVMATVSYLAGLRFAELEGNLENRFEIRPRGSLGLGGARSKPLPFGTAEQIRSLAPDVRVEPYLIRREFENDATLFFVGHNPGTPMLAVGEPEPMDTRLIAGRVFRSGEAHRRVTVLGLDLGKRFGLNPDSLQEWTSVPMLGEEWQVVGIFDSRNGYSNHQAFFPLDAMKAAVQAGGYSKVIVQAANAARAWQVAEALQKVLGERADIVTNREASGFVQAMLGGVSATSKLGAAVFFSSAVLVVFGAMVLHFREQILEVGIEKALGASDALVGTRLVLESVILTLAGGIGGLGLTVLGLSIYSRSWTSIKFGFVDSPLSELSMGILLAACFLVGAVGSLYPVLRCRRLSPVQILRNE